MSQDAGPVVATRAHAAAPASAPIATESTLGRLMPRLLRVLAREPALAVTCAYLLVAMAGIFFVDRYYARFGIPVLSLSQISDFLVAGVQQPVALLLVLSTLPIIWMFDWVNVRAARRQRAAHARLAALERRNAWQRLQLRWFSWKLGGGHAMRQLAYLGILFGYGWVFVATYADYRVRLVEQGRARQVRVWQGGEALRPSQGETWSYLGAVSAYVFVYDRAARQAQVLPLEGIDRIEPLRPVAEAAAPAPQALAPKR